MEEGKKMEKKGRVCVTGGNGFIASWLIKRLLEGGYSVNATIRSSASPDRKNIGYLTDLPGASERLRIFNAELDEPESFDAAVEGCIGVFHLAHPKDFEGKETEEAMIKRSVNGATGILQACLNSKTVKRVVYTSSASAVVFNEKKLDVMDETIWSDADFLRANFGQRLSSYAIPKIFTEKAALEFPEEKGLDVVTVAPAWVLGPFICPFLPSSMRSSMAMIFGHKEMYGLLLRTCFVHIEDLTRALIFLLENPKAKGRYICSAVDLTIDELSKSLSARYPEYPPIPPTDSLKDVKGFTCAGLSSKKLLDLGFEYNYGIEEMFDGSIESCKQKGFL